MRRTENKVLYFLYDEREIAEEIYREREETVLEKSFSILIVIALLNELLLSY